MNEKNIKETPNFQEVALGQRGFRKVDSNTTLSGEQYAAVQIVEDVTGLEITTNTGDDLGPINVAAPAMFYGPISNVVVTGGTALAYLK